MYRTVITKQAEEDIVASARYIAEELQNPDAAIKLFDDVEAAIDSLEQMPKRQALVKNEGLARLGFRFLPVNNYLIFYIVREEKKQVTIERFLHSRRDWINIL